MQPKNPNSEGRKMHVLYFTLVGGQKDIYILCESVPTEDYGKGASNKKHVPQLNQYSFIR